jgi:hypothetical protein
VHEKKACLDITLINGAINRDADMMRAHIISLL